MIRLTINNKAIEVPEGTSILEAAKANSILIPNLCYLEDVQKIGSCRICVVEVKGMPNLQASCVTNVKEGMVVHTNSQRVRKARRVIYELILSDHPTDCLICERNQACELQTLGEILQVGETRFSGERSKIIVDDSSLAVVRDHDKCILCRRCVTTCNEIQGVRILDMIHRGFASTISTGLELPLGETSCTNCGQCVNVCPVGALKEKDATEMVWEALQDPERTVIVQTAPAVRVALGEEFGLEPGSNVTGKMAASLWDLGFDHVFDTNFAADLTIIEEGTELLQRLITNLYLDGVITEEQVKKTGIEPLTEKVALPMITSCSPGWIKYAEHYFPDQLEHISTCKSPHMMLGALIKSHFAEISGIDPDKMFVVSIMPCTAKKFEANREELRNDGRKNVDAVLTTRELAKMIKDAGIDFLNLQDRDFENPLGISTGAADIFGVTGGVMEAALRTVYEIVTGRELPFEGLHVGPMMGLDRIKSATVTIENPTEAFSFLDGAEVGIASTSGLAGAATLLAEIKEGKSPYTFIEIMGCPGGCISGGGQPRMTSEETRIKRMKGIYTEDESKTLRKSHENPFITKIYEEFLEKPLGHKSHELLHTHYIKRKKY